MEPVCYLDLDGVLTNFVAGALARHGVTIPPADVRWDFWRQCSPTEAGFWAPLGFDFWAGLPWTAEGKALLAGVEKLFGPENIVLLTSPCPTAGCVDGKLAWVKREIPQHARNVMVGSAKERLAAPCKLLIDDHDGNVKKFADAGGQALLVPRPWNALRAVSFDGRFVVADVLNQVETILGKMRR